MPPPSPRGASASASVAATHAPAIGHSGRILTAKYLRKASSKKDLVARLRRVLGCLRDDPHLEAEDTSGYPGLAGLCGALTGSGGDPQNRGRRAGPIHHRDKEVRLYAVAACMELFALYAPAAPWNEAETLDIFGQTIRQLANLGHTHTHTHTETTKGAHFYEYYRILELLAEVKIAVLLVDLSKKNDDDNDNSGGNSSSHSTTNHNAARPSGNQTNREALLVLTELFRTLLQSVRNGHPPEVLDCCRKTLTSCIEEFFETTFLPVPLLDELLVCIGQGPRVLVLKQQQQEQKQKQKQEPPRGKPRAGSGASGRQPLPAPVVTVRQNNPSYAVASAVVRASVERLSTPIASLLNGLVQSDPRAVGASTISNHACEASADSNAGAGNEPPVPRGVLEMADALGRPQRQTQDPHGSSNVYGVILELQRVAPAILTTVFGNLASHVETTDVGQRLLVVETLGRLFAGSGSGDAAGGTGRSGLSVAAKNRESFFQWLQRSGDRRIEIRRRMLPHLLALTRAGSSFLEEAGASSLEASLALRVQEALLRRLSGDPSPAFRTEVVQGLCTLSYNHRKILTRRAMDQLGERVMSRDRAERKDALTGLVQLHFRQYTLHHLAAVLEGGDDCPIGSVLDVLRRCSFPGDRASAAGAFSAETAASLIAARSRNAAPESCGRRRGPEETDDDDEPGPLESPGFSDRGGRDDFSYYQWIPCVLFESASYSDATDADMHSRVVQLVDELLLGCSSPHPDNRRRLTSTGRATAMAIVVDAVRKQSHLAGLWMTKLQSVRARLQNALKAYLEARAEIRRHETGSEEYFAADAKAKDLLETVASMIPPPSGASPAPGERHAVLEKFHSSKDKRVFLVLGTITNPSHSSKCRAKAIDDLPKRVKATAGDAVSAWVKSLAKRCAMGDFVNLDVVHHCVLLAQECFHEGDLDATLKFLVCVQMAVESFPSLCASGEVFENLSELFQDCNGSSQKNQTEGPAIVTALSAILASVAPYRDPSDDSSLLEDDLYKKLVNLCRNGTPEQARHAVATITSLLKPKNGAELTQEETKTFLPLLETLATPSRLAIASTGSSTKLVCVLAALTELANNAPQVFESSSRGTKALKFALEMVLMGRARVDVTSGDDDDDYDEADDTRTPKRGRNRKSSSAKSRHLSPKATDTSLVEDQNLSIPCRTICAAIELLSAFIRSSVFVAKKSRSTFTQTTQDIIEQSFKIFSQILRDQGLPPSSRDRDVCSFRQDRAALRQCAAIHLFRLCDTRLGLDQKHLTTERWHTLASSLLDDEPVVRKAAMEEFGLMITGHGKFSTAYGMGVMAPRLRFVAMSVFCIDGSQGSHSKANGNSANIGKAIHNQKGNIAGCITDLRKVYESYAVQCRAQGPEAEKQFETFTKLTIMPEYAVPYSFHLLTCRQETPSSTGPSTGKSRKANDDDESGQRILRKRLKALYDPLVLQLGTSADNISFLLRMAEMLAKSFQPIGCSLSSPGSDNSSRDGDKLKNICATAREVLLSYVKTDANLDTHPGAIRMPGNLFRKRQSRKRPVQEDSITTDTSPIIDMMITTQDSEIQNQKISSNLNRKRPASSKEHEKHTQDHPFGNNNTKQEQTRRSTRSATKHDVDGSKTTAKTDEASRNSHDTQASIADTSRRRRSLRISTRTASIGSTNTYGDGDSRVSSSTDEISGYSVDGNVGITRKNTQQIAPRRSTRSTRSTKFDDSRDSSTSGSISIEHGNESTENGTGTIESTPSSKDVESTVTSTRGIMLSTEGEDDPSSSRLGSGSNKKRRSDASKSISADSRVHFSPEIDFGGLSPINRRSSRNSKNEELLLSSSETKTRGTTPPSSLRNASFPATASASVAIGSPRPHENRDSKSPTTVSESTAKSSIGRVSSQGNEKTKPLGDKKAEVAHNRRRKSSRKLAVDDKENATAIKKKGGPKDIKIVRSKQSSKFKAKKVVKKTALASVGKRGKRKSSKPIDSFDFEG
ncbi:unnamed protein product [Pseudo-nitzschia multistriata]|uniref:Sister chromatid cohesion protein n=1 Tax=Pseudo-nitzschia multistriata TaxID=183589 RepID=A0A448ZIT8_9STRA|nr:unnamed protein product [Pseudo-nitzschia multistriata]